MFAAVGAAVGYLLMVVPNVEAITAVLFVAGYVLGVKRGILSATIASILYFGFNPQGGLFPPLLFAQIIGIIAAPIAGGLFRKIKTKGFLVHPYLVISAIGVTLWYDLLTNLAFPISVGFDLKGIVITLIAGIPFSLVHIVGNTVIFIFLIPLLIDVINRHQPTG